MRDMGDVTISNAAAGFRLRLWRGESMCLLGFDIEDPEDDFVGFAVEFCEPGEKTFKTLNNRLSFNAADYVVDGYRNAPTTKAPLQTFRWVHFPWEPRQGTYTYRVTKMHMPQDGVLKKGQSVQLPVDLGPVTIENYLDVGFARNFASSQAFLDKCMRLGITDPNTILPKVPADGLSFAPQRHDIATNKKGDIYQWLGYEAYTMLFDFLDWAITDPSITIDAMAFDLNEPKIVARLGKLEHRLRIIIDDSDKHGKTTSAESQSAAGLLTTAGGQVAVHRGHFIHLQHNKILIAKRNGVPIRVLGGSTNFSYRGLYIQANNMYVFDDKDVAGAFSQMFDLAFTEMDSFGDEPLSKSWVWAHPQGQKAVRLCFSPHSDPGLSLGPVGGAIDQAASSVFYSFAFMNQIKTGAVREALDRLIERPIFSYGIVNNDTDMEIKKPSGEIGLVDFEYLAKLAPEPFKREWSGGQGIHIHHKFAVVDFDQPHGKVYTGSSNFSPAGESDNGDHMLVIENQRVAAAYAIEALRVFDHLAFRSRMKDAAATKKKSKETAAKKKPKEDPLVLLKPLAFAPPTQNETWFAKFYVKDSQRERDRQTFAQP